MKSTALLLALLFGLVVGKGLTGGSLELGTVSTMPTPLKLKGTAVTLMNIKHVSSSTIVRYRYFIYNPSPIYL
jgi:hypothetical protein